MGIFSEWRNSAAGRLVGEQRWKELLIHRRFRIPDEYLRREVLSRLEGETVKGLTFSFHEGYGRIGAEVKKSFLPFTIHCSARVMIEEVRFTSGEKKLFLRLDELRPLDFPWLTRRLVERLPFAAYADGIMVCDLMQVPQLAKFLDYRVKGIRISDIIAIKELSMHEGEIIGRLGLSR